MGIVLKNKIHEKAEEKKRKRKRTFEQKPLSTHEDIWIFSHLYLYAHI